MLSIDDTIVAVATPAGHGGIGVVRMSGPAANAIGQRLAGRARPWTPRRATRAQIHTAVGPADVVVTSFAAPASYTGEDVLELSAHGNPVVLAAIVDTAVACGADAAERGEFTLRAFVRGKIDLVQAGGACAISSRIVGVLDRSRPLDDAEHAFVDSLADRRAIVVANKVDLPDAWGGPARAVPASCEVSARASTGMADLQRRIGETIRGASTQAEATLVTNVRHRALLADIVATIYI